MYNFKLSRLLLVACWISIQNLWGLAGVAGVWAKPLNTNSTQRSVKFVACPEDIEALTALLLKDLPSYANRVIQRSRPLSRTNDRFYVVVAGRPEFEPLPLNPSQSPSFTPATDQTPPQQIFFTTLERRYVGGKAVESQLYHWLFLTQTPSGWRLALMFSQIGASAPGRPPTPPQESSNGIVGQAVSNWLRDCRARAIRS